jgi:cytochrome c-type biogenesis protein CcmH/NrfG
MNGHGVRISLKSAAAALKVAPAGNASNRRDWKARMFWALAMAERIDRQRNRGRMTEKQVLIARAKSEMLTTNLSTDQPTDKKGFRLYVQGRLLCSVEDFDLAQRAFLAANRLIPRSEKIAEGMFACAFATSNVRQAFFWAARLTQLNPKNAQNWLKLAVCWMARRVGCEAQGAIEVAIDLEPENEYFRRFWIEADDSDPELGSTLG